MLPVADVLLVGPLENAEEVLHHGTVSFLLDLPDEAGPRPLLEIVEKLCTHVAIIHRGQLVADGPLDRCPWCHTTLDPDLEDAWLASMVSGFAAVEEEGRVRVKVQTGDAVVEELVDTGIQRLVGDLKTRRRLLFLSEGDACRSQMASAFTQYLAGDKIEAISAGSEPAENINPEMVKAMQEKGIDMAFRRTRPLSQAVSDLKPDMIISMGCQEECPLIPGAQIQDWDLPDPAGKSMDVMCNVRDEIEKKVKVLVNNTLS